MQMTSLRQAANWTGWAFLLNLLWELAQLPFYAFAPAAGLLDIAWAVVHCTAGDGGIALASFGVAALVTRSPDWPMRRPGLGIVVAVVFGLGWTVQSEWANVYMRGAWAYGPSMPLVRGIGVLPLLQWLLLPPLVLMRARGASGKPASIDLGGPHGIGPACRK